MGAATVDAQIDYSKWCGFFNEEAVFASKVVIEQMIKDLQDELKDRENEDK